MTAGEFANLALFLLVVINPVSKMALVATLSRSHTSLELRKMSRDASLISFTVLAVFAFAGKFILRDVFHINLYSVEFAGGAAIFLVGLKALWEGRFFSFAPDEELSQLSAAPVAMPMIAGPAAIAAVISAAVRQPPWLVSLAVLPGAFANFVAMLLAAVFAGALAKSRILAPLVRIMGLFVAAIGAEMLLRGFGAFVAANFPAAGR